jgi:hypothetical protein
MMTTWRRHSCLPGRDSSRPSWGLPRRQKRVETSLDPADTSVRATSAAVTQSGSTRTGRGSERRREFKVGRTPWSAAGQLAGLPLVGHRLIVRGKSGTGASRADQGVRPTTSVCAMSEVAR